MAFISNHLSFLFLIFLFSCIQVQARESKFFSKFNTDNVQESELPQEQVSSLKQDEEPTFTQQTTNGYGLYGHGSSQNPSTTTTSTSQEFPEKASTEGYPGEGYQEKEVPIGHHGSANYGYGTKQFGMTDTRYMDNVNVNSNNGYETKYETRDTSFSANKNNNGYKASQYDPSDAGLQRNDNSGYRTKEFGQSDSRVLDNGKISSNNAYETKQGTYDMSQNKNDNSGYRTKEFGQSDSRVLDNGKISSNNGYETKQGTYDMSQNKNDISFSWEKQQGLSDTRFMENGRYFYNVNNENSHLNKYQPVSRSFDGFRSSQRVDSRNNYNYGNNQNTYEAEQNQNEFSP